MTRSPVSGSMERLVAELSAVPGVPIVLIGDIGSGRSAVVQAAATSAGLTIFAYEACTLTASGASALPWQRNLSGSGGLQTRLDELIALAALRGGDPIVVVVDHLDSVLVAHQAAIVEALDWVAGQLRVVVIAERVPAFPAPPHWRVVSHAAADVARWAPRPAQPTVGDIGL